MGVLLLVCPGDGDAAGLSPAGREQARSLGRRLADQPAGQDVRHVITGSGEPLRRTAELCGLAVPLTVDPRLDAALEPHAAAELAASPGVSVAVAPPAVVAAACAHWLGAPDRTARDLARALVPTSVSKVITGASGTWLLSFNDAAHLEPGL